MFPHLRCNPHCIALAHLISRETVAQNHDIDALPHTRLLKRDNSVLGIAEVILGQGNGGFVSVPFERNHDSSASHISIVGLFAESELQFRFAATLHCTEAHPLRTGHD